MCVAAVQSAAACAGTNSGNEQLGVWGVKSEYLLDRTNFAIERFDCKNLGLNQRFVASLEAVLIED